MTELNQGEQLLLEQVRRGDAEAWTQLVDRFQGRLCAFARARGIREADADDLVQDTFLDFLRSLPGFRGEASLETWLFMILRRRIVDLLRGRRLALCSLRETLEDSSGPAEVVAPPAPDLTASAYARRDEQLQREGDALAAALGELVGELKSAGDLRDLKIIEMLFYAQLRNRDIAKLAGVEENLVAQVKHRWLKRLRGLISARLGREDVPAFESAAGDSLLTETWENLRPSCPKRSTVGGYLLGTLEPAWQEYVGFHVRALGCRFCQANLADLEAQSTTAPRDLRERIMQSTVGFLKR